MRNIDAQRLMAAAGYYKGKLDGLLGSESRKAAFKILDRHPNLVKPTSSWSNQRAAIAAAQIVLTFAGYSPGAIDGYAGHNTNEAFNDWAAQIGQGGRQLGLEPVDTHTPVKSSFPSQAGCVAFYGKPGLAGSAEDKAMQAKLVDVTFPFAFRIDYNLDQKATRMRLHSKCAESAQKAINQTVNYYGESQFRKLGLDRFAGSYMPRLMRGSKTTFSMHAYGCAHDWYAAPNGLTTRCPQALFCGEEYKAFFDIWEANGWTSLGRAIGRDWMHLQAASI